MSMSPRESVLLAALAGLLASSGACSKRDDAGKPSGVPPLDPGAAAAAPPAPPPVAAAPPPPVAPAPSPA
ncbi:MAG TPA: hypothetical protein VHG72_12015, partial [Polyangia bacterium]|nr:hypothetical protein [Polyangia bacterium]